MTITKPFITYVANDFILPQSLKTAILNDLPSEGIEWQRSYGRPSKTVYIEAQLIPFSEEHIVNYKQPTDKKENVLHLPLLHTFWIELGENDSYKNTSKEEVASWINKLRDNGINEWLVVVLETGDSKKSNKTKLLSTRSSAVDKVKADFPPNIKSPGDHCISLPENCHSGAKASEHYTAFLSRLRYWLLASYSKQLTAYEDFIRTERERRNVTDWNFFEFFFLQEELAFAFETLGLYDEALVQYDELDALFSQFVINSHVGEIAEWLRKLSEDCLHWHGLCLASAHSSALRKKLQGPNRSLLDLRSYLFARQCELLLLHNRPWELASRSLPFLQNCVNELKMLEIVLPEGALACWVFLSALEILQKCERYSDSSQMETYSRHTVELWAYVRKKLEELGTLCGLMPDQKHTSDCLHKVVSLIGGIGDDFYADRDPPSPQSRLKEALSKPEAFLKTYLEISELTMGTYKHIGRMRSARLVGLELAILYMKMNKQQQALPFLIELEKIYLTENWSVLLTDVRRLLFECYDILGDNRKKIRYACLLAAALSSSSSGALDAAQRAMYMAVSKDLMAKFETEPKDQVISRMDEIFPVVHMSFPGRDPIVTNSPVDLELIIQNNLLEAINVQCLEVSLKVEQAIKTTPRPKIVRQQSVENCPHGPQKLVTRQDSNPNFPHNAKQPSPDLRTYHSAAGVGVKCPNISRCLKRSDSHGLFVLDKDPQKDNSESKFFVENIRLESGSNTVTLSFEPKSPVCHTLHQVSLSWSPQVLFVTTQLPGHACFGVMSEEPSLKVLRLTTLDNTPFELLSGIPQSIVLELNAGTSRFEKGTKLHVKSSRELLIKLETDIGAEMTYEIEVSIPVALKPFETFPMPLLVKGRLINQRDTSATEYTLTLSYGSNSQKTSSRKVCTSKSVSTSIHLIPPFMSTLRLHTSHTRKFAEVIVHGATHRKFDISKPLLYRNDHQDELQIVGNAKKLVVTKDQSVHLLWELDEELVASKLILKLEYDLMPDSKALTASFSPEMYECDFKLNNYKTMFTIRANVEPQKGFEFCRVGTLCNLQVTIERVCPEKEACAVMYEVIGDSATWNVTGRSAGVIEAPAAKSSSTASSSLTFDILPLTSGYLPLPTVRVSKYVTSSTSTASVDQVPRATVQTDRRPSMNNDQGAQLNLSSGSNVTEARLVAFDVGQVYNCSRAAQVHVLPSSGLIHLDN